jgi:hypothetical protein
MMTRTRMMSRTLAIYQDKQAPEDIVIHYVVCMNQIILIDELCCVLLHLEFGSPFICLATRASS